RTGASTRGWAALALAGSGLRRFHICGSRRRNRGDEVLQRELEPKRPRSGPVDEREHGPAGGARCVEARAPLAVSPRRYRAERGREDPFDAFEPVAAVDEQGGPVGIERDVVWRRVVDHHVELPL